MRRLQFGFLLASALLASRAAGQTKTGTTIAQFMGIEPSARIAAMGNAGVAVDDPIQSIYYNPGVLGSVSATTFQFSHGFWFADISYDYVGVVLPAGNWGNFFASLTALNSGEIDVRTVSQPLGTGQRYSVRDLAIGVGYGRQISNRFAAGGQVQFVSESIWHTDMRVVTGSVGTSYRLSDGGLTLGASLLQFGTKGQFDGGDLTFQFDANPDQNGDNSALPGRHNTDEFAVPILFRVGVSYPRRLSESTRLLLVADAYHPSDNTEALNLGWEWTWKDALAVRGGYQGLYQQDTEVGMTLGVGVRTGPAQRRFQLDYAWAYHSFLQETHRVTFVLSI